MNNMYVCITCSWKAYISDVICLRAHLALPAILEGVNRLQYCLNRNNLVNVQSAFDKICH